MWYDSVPKVRNIRIAIHGQSAGGAWPMEAGRMKSKSGNIDHVSLLGDHNAIVLDGVTNLAGHDQPELRAFRMIMAAVFGVQWRQIFFVTVNNVSYSPVVMDEPPTIIGGDLGQFI